MGEKEKCFVWGFASTESIDKENEVVSKKALEKAVTEYSRWRNIREMHQSKTVGKAKHIVMLEKGLLIGAEITDMECWDKIKSGIYKGFSIGGMVGDRETQIRGGKPVSVITQMSIAEVSVVDQPANNDAGFMLVCGMGKDMGMFGKWFGKAADEVERTVPEEFVDDFSEKLNAVTEIVEKLMDICEELDKSVKEFGARLEAIEARFTKTKAMSGQTEPTKPWMSVIGLLS
ncbi:MAG: HK97 family phage prohead protease [Caldisericia bacterium]|nr:HK97 family phage prohead protease [Caldisericia bacterium]